MLAATGQLFRRLCWFVRRHPVAITVVVFVAVLLLSVNLCGMERYSVDVEWGTMTYGMPMPYRIVRDEVVRPGCYPLIATPLVPFDFDAMACDLAIALAILLVSAAVAFSARIRLLRQRCRGVCRLVVTLGLLAVVLLASVAETAAYKRQQSILSEIKRRGGTAWADYPVPYALWSSVARLARLWFSQEEIVDFLDASIGTVVFLQGPPTLLEYVGELPGLRAIDIVDDLEDVWEYVPVRLSPRTSPLLERIRVELGQITDLRDVIELPRLRFLAIRGNPDPECLRAVNDLKNLEELDLTECWTPGDVIQFDKLNRLRILVVGQVGEATVRSIGRLPRLAELYLGGELSEEAISTLQNMQSLRKLDLEGCLGINDNAAKVLTHLTELRYLNVWGSSITDAGLRNLVSLRNLEELVLGSTPVTHQGIAVLTGLPRLKRLNLCGTAVDDRIGLVVHDLQGLESLDLNSTKITDKALVNLRGLKSLRSLDLSNTKITDQSIDCLLQMKSLREVALNGTAVTAKGVVRLQSLPGLQRLRVYDCLAVSWATLRDLQKLMPNVSILEPVHDTLMPPAYYTEPSTLDVGHAPTRREK